MMQSDGLICLYAYYFPKSCLHAVIELTTSQPMMHYNEREKFLAPHRRISQH